MKAIDKKSSIKEEVILQVLAYKKYIFNFVLYHTRYPQKHIALNYNFCFSYGTTYL